MKITRLTCGVLEANCICVTIPNFRALELLGAGLPFFDELCGVCIDRRFIALTEAPGLGITLDEDIARHYPKPGEEFF
ncbi:MAG: hypothetical protein NTW74_18460 [Acidobacteria bacterium]|nr:hypothetical protein [Acidobacteriota bacterium]